MATFIVLCTFERAGVQELLGDPAADGRPTAGELMAAAGGELKHVWMCAGMYDLVAVVEAESLQNALSFLVAYSSLGQMRTVTLAAESNVSGILSEARRAATDAGWIDRGGDIGI